MEYPRWRHHATKPMRLVNNPEEEELLGEGWADSPAAFIDAPEAAPAPIPLPAEGDEPEPGTESVPVKPVVKKARR